MQVIGFDIGIKNLAYCIINVEGEVRTLVTVNKVDLKCRKNDTQKIIDAAIDLMDTILFTELNTEKPITVVIESQMTAVMKCIQTVINTYFKVTAKYQSLSVATKYMSAQNKLRLIDKFPEYERAVPTASTAYKQNKLDGIHFGKWLMANKYTNEEILQRLDKIKKADDEYDAFLTAVAFIVLSS
jgi:hypothetical protein